MAKKKLVDFKRIKSTVSIEAVLKDHGVDWLKRKGDNLVGRCPFHQNAEGETAFQASVSKNIWHCFSCNRKGNVIDLEAEFEGIEFAAAARRLGDKYLGKTVKESKKVSAPVPEPAKEETPKENVPLKFHLMLQRDHVYLQGRGFPPETIETFDCGYCSRGLLKDRIAFAIHDDKGNVVAYAGRGLQEPFTDQNPKYKFPPGFSKELVLYNLHRSRPFIDQSKTVIIVEGFMATLWLWQNGFKNVVATMGSALCRGQQKLLEDIKANIVICFDGDDAGRGGAQAAAQSLAQKCFVRIVDVGDNRQPDNLSPEELQKILS